MDIPTTPKTKDTFYHYINPVCLDVGMWGCGGLEDGGVTGALGLQKKVVTP